MAVFEDLWAKGLCVAGGSNYGADYVVYDGKPFILASVTRETGRNRADSSVRPDRCLNMVGQYLDSI